VHLYPQTHARTCSANGSTSASQAGGAGSIPVGCSARPARSTVADWHTPRHVCYAWPCGAVRSARRPVTAEVAGSNPVWVAGMPLTGVKWRAGMPRAHAYHQACLAQSGWGSALITRRSLVRFQQQARSREVMAAYRPFTPGEMGSIPAGTSTSAHWIAPGSLGFHSTRVSPLGQRRRIGWHQHLPHVEHDH
jgi:hypothetical protein